MSKFDFLLSPPFMNAAGMFGFAPDLTPGLDWSSLGAFVTAPISLAPRRPAQMPQTLDYPGGFLLHTGLPNPGLSKVLESAAPRWRRASLPVWVHIFGQTHEEITRMVTRLERVDGVAGVELGLPPEVGASEMLQMVQAAQGEIPLLIQLPFERARELSLVLLSLREEPALVGVTLSAPRGLLPGADGRLISGRLYGPSVFPAALALARTLSLLFQGRWEMIASGGIYTASQAEAFFQAGAKGVQLDTVLWRGGWEA